jgi:cell division transport system permease protein
VNRLNANKAQIKSVKFVSKAAGFKDMEKTEPALTKGLAYNPLPDSLEVTPTKGEYVQAVAQSLYGAHHQLPPGVASLSDGKQLSKRILQVAHVIEAVFTVATLVLLIASTLLIANTIRLSIFSRRREIEVMKLVGATNWFVRGPFMVEGLLCGLGGSLLAVFFLVLGKEIALPSILHGSLSGSSGVHALAFPVTSLILVGMGLGLGALGSGVTLHRFLRV